RHRSRSAARARFAQSPALPRQGPARALAPRLRGPRGAALREARGGARGRARDEQAVREAQPRPEVRVRARVLHARALGSAAPRHLLRVAARAARGVERRGGPGGRREGPELERGAPVRLKGSLPESSGRGRMDTKTALWFCIERTFARVFELCLEARAAELIVQQKAAEGGLLRGLSGETSVLPAVTDSNAAERDERAVELARSPAFRESHENGADVVALRSELRRVLGELRAKLHEVLTEHEVYYVLFPIVVYCDELVATATRGAVTRWEPMQGEFYEIENG